MAEFMVNLSYTETPLRENLDEFIKNKETDKMKNRSPYTWKNNYKVLELDNIKSIQRLVASDYRCYSAGYFTDGRAVNINWQFQNCVIFDVDGGITLEEAAKTFGRFTGLLATTKSHTAKNHRFRVILPMQERTYCTYSDYSRAMRLIMDSAYPFLDKQCKDASRIYFGNSNAEFVLLNGSALFDFNSWVVKAKQIAKAEEWGFTKKRLQSINEGTKPEWYRSHWKSPEMLKVLKHSEKFWAGSRNGTLYSWAKYLLSIGLDDVEVADAIFWLNSNGDGIPEEEIRRTIFRSLKLVLQ